MKYRKYMVMVLSAVLAAGVLAGCTAKPEEPGKPEESESSEEPITGGNTRYVDPDAPSSIESKEITSFSASFYMDGPFFSDIGNGYFDYSITAEDGKYILSEDRYYDYSTETGGEVLQEVQEIIDKYSLVKRNGLYDVTDGIDPAYGPASLDVYYASGERLHFYADSSPEEEWKQAFRKLFDRIFAESGLEAAAPDPDDYTIDHFSLEYNEGPVHYEYATIVCADKVRVMYLAWDEEKRETVAELYAGMEGGFLERFSDLIEELGLQELANRASYSGAHGLDDYLEIHVDYVSGRQIYGEYRNEDARPQKWEEVKEKVLDFFDTWIKEHLEADSYEALQLLGPDADRYLAYSFLAEFFTPGKDGRYETFREQLEQAAGDEEAGTAAVENYHSGIRRFLTEDLLREIELNRTLARFDSLYGNTEDGWEISYGEIPEPDDGAGPADGLYPFHIELTDGTETREINGELKCRETEDGWKISELRFDLQEE